MDGDREKRLQRRREREKEHMARMRLEKPEKYEEFLARRRARYHDRYREKSKEYRDKNHDRIRERQKTSWYAYYERHRDEILSYQRKHYAENSEKIRNRNKARYESHREIERANRRAHYANNKDAYADYRKSHAAERRSWDRIHYNRPIDPSIPYPVKPNETRKYSNGTRATRWRIHRYVKALQDLGIPSDRWPDEIAKIERNHEYRRKYLKYKSTNYRCTCDWRARRRAEKVELLDLTGG